MCKHKVMSQSELVSYRKGFILNNNCTDLSREALSCHFCLGFTDCIRPFSAHTEEENRKIFFYCEAGEPLAPVAQRTCGCSIPRNIQGQVGCDSEQPDLVEDVPAKGVPAGVGLGDL